MEVYSTYNERFYQVIFPNKVINEKGKERKKQCGLV
jgi:hypothetical protein